MDYNIYLLEKDLTKLDSLPSKLKTLKFAQLKMPLPPLPPTLEYLHIQEQLLILPSLPSSLSKLHIGQYKFPLYTKHTSLTSITCCCSDKIETPSLIHANIEGG